MPLIDLARISYTRALTSSDYYVGAVVNSSSGPDEVKIIYNETDLDTYFPNLEYREGYIKILDTGANLVLKRINNLTTRVATLRLTTNPYLRYVYPLIYNSVEYVPKDDNSFESGIIFDSLNNSFSYDDLIGTPPFKLSGIIYGSYSQGDIITAKVNGITTSTTLNEDGIFSFDLAGVNLYQESHCRIEVTLSTLNGSELVSIKDYFYYSLSGKPSIRLNLDELAPDNLIIYQDIPTGSTTFTISGVVYGDYQGNPIYIFIGENFYLSYPNDFGVFTYDLPIDDILNNNSLRIETFASDDERDYFDSQEVSYITDYLDLNLSSLPEHQDAYIDIQTRGNKTLCYDIDFGTSRVLDEDYLVIPRANAAKWDRNILIYYVPESNPFKTPDEFDKPVRVESVDSPQYRVLIPNDPVAAQILRQNRAKYVYDLFTSDDGSGMDFGVIKKLCVLDELNNKVRLVFHTPISDIDYFSSNDSTAPFTVSTDEDFTNELLTRFSRNESVVSFSSRIEGDIEVKLTLTWIEGYKFYLKESYEDKDTTYLVSLYEYDRDYNGENIFIEDVINYNSELLKCQVHFKNRIKVNTNGTFDDVNSEFKIADAKLLQGSYLVTKGIEGSNNLTDLTPYSTAVDMLFNSGVDLNIFLTDVFNEKEYLNILNSYLTEYQVVGFTDIPDRALGDLDPGNVSGRDDDLEHNLDYFLIPDSKREFLIYCFGDCFVNGLYYIPSSFYQVAEVISGTFIGPLSDNIIMSDLKDEDRAMLDSRFINYLEETNSQYNVTNIVNLPRYLEPIYLLTSIYIKQYLTRYLRGQIGEFPYDLLFNLKNQVAILKGYTSLIKKLKISNFDIRPSIINATFELELTGLMGKVLSIDISLNAN